MTEANATLAGSIQLPAPAPQEPSVLELEDMLYDILANGADPNLAPGTLEAVQTFVHEHARNKRSRPEFLAFFARHGLSTARAAGLSISLPPMELRTAAPPPAIAETAAEAIVIEPAAAAATGASRAPIWITALAALAALSGGAYYGLTVAQAELERVRAEARANADALTKMQAEAASLRQSVEQNSELLRRTDRKNELLLQTFASPLDPNLR